MDSQDDTSVQIYVRPHQTLASHGHFVYWSANFADPCDRRVRQHGQLLAVRHNTQRPSSREFGFYFRLYLRQRLDVNTMHDNILHDFLFDGNETADIVSRGVDQADGIRGVRASS